jgi:purine-nucleoside phosphorylase
VTFPVRLAHRLGAELLLLTNAAGGIAPELVAGSLMLLDGHVSLLPLRTFGLPGIRTRGPYDEALLGSLEEAALREGVRLRRGVYAWVMGPSYETPAEIRALRRIGADAVGMSTIPEVVQAHALGMRVAAVSAITNRAAGLTGKALSHEEVLRAGTASANNLERLLKRFLREVSAGSDRSRA